MKGRRAIHPLLIAAVFVVTLWAHNRAEVRTAEALPVLGVVLGATAVVWLVITLAFRDHRRAAMATTGLAALFLSFGHVWPLVDHIVKWREALLGVWAVLGIGVVWLAARSREHVSEVTTILNGTAVAMLIVAGLPLITGLFSSGPVAEATSPASPIATSTPRQPMRDIYYIVPDRYGANSTLTSHFQFDNSEFTDFLEGNGFTVVEDALAPYGKTAHSLAATLNMTYLDALSDAYPASNRWTPVWSMLDDHSVGRFLKTQGYTYVHIGNWWGPTKDSSIADINLYPDMSEFTSVFVDTTALGPIAGPLGLGGADLRERRRYSINFDFQALHDVQELPGPKFVFSHITLPHDPYVFDADGSPLASDVTRSRSRRDNFVNHVRYANLRLTQLVDELLAGPYETDPIIIIQADEGPYPVEAEGTRYRNFRWDEATPYQLREHIPVFSAYYLPGLDEDPTYPTLSPVNTFRVIFREYFGADLPLLADRSFMFRDEQHLYDFVEVTDKVRGEPTP